MERDSIDEILNYEFEAFEENDGQYWLSKETEANFDREKCCLLKSIFTFAGPKNWLKIQKTSQSLEKQNLKNSESVSSWSLDPKLWPCVPIDLMQISTRLPLKATLAEVNVTFLNFSCFY